VEDHQLRVGVAAGLENLSDYPGLGVVAETEEHRSKVAVGVLNTLHHPQNLFGSEEAVVAHELPEAHGKIQKDQT
jgi:hypothetical protein